MAGFQPWTSGVQNNLSTNWATTTYYKFIQFALIYNLYKTNDPYCQTIQYYQQLQKQLITALIHCQYTS